MVAPNSRTCTVRCQSGAMCMRWLIEWQSLPVRALSVAIASDALMAPVTHAHARRQGVGRQACRTKHRRAHDVKKSITADAMAFQHRCGVTAA